VLQREPLCRAHRTGRLDLGRGAWQAVEVRTEGASVVDHILARELGGSEDESNLQPLCVACNKTKTIADVKAVQARRVPCTS
jgi:5-methylcytosine-specific restriction endonuclease McrA